MMFRHYVFEIAFCFYFAHNGIQEGNSYRILGIFPTPSISHQIVFRALTLALNERGHELVVITTDPINNLTLKNYTEINIDFFYDVAVFRSINYIQNRISQNGLQLIEDIPDGMYHIVEAILDNKELRRLYEPGSNEKFDLVMVEVLYWHSLSALAHRFDAPLIGITSLGMTSWNQHVIGNPTLPSHYSNWELGSEIFEETSLWNRIKNFIRVWKHLYWYRTTYIPKHQSIAKKYLGNDIPDLLDIEKNISLIFVNQRLPISFTRPSVPKVINIGGFHVSKKNSSLPENLQKFLDSATSGFVYMSLGTNAKSTMIPNATINEFNEAFSRLPYKVLWKFEADVLPGKPDNVRIMEWVPQEAVLAHPNLKVFIYQGGLQSTEEAINHAVPLIGFPVLGDQDMQVTKMTTLGVAIKLEILTMNGNELYEAINTVANDISYKENMIKLRSVMEDEPYDSLKNAVWWTEYVIRHKGAPHLHSSTADEPWYRQQDMDIVALISAASIIILIIITIVLYYLGTSIYTLTFARPHNSKLKIN